MLGYLKRGGYKGRALDIGASIGNHTVYFANELGCEVVSVDPFEPSFKHLKENVKLNDLDVELINVALGDKEGIGAMKSMSKGNVGMQQVVIGQGVKIKTLDGLKLGQLDFIKIDVEHYNIPLLKGAKETLHNQVKCDVFIECESNEIRRDTNEIMKSYGYKLVKGVKLNHTPTYLWKK